MKKLIFTIALLFIIPISINAQWEYLNEGLEGRINTIDFVTEDIGWLAVENGTLLNTEDGGENWNPIPNNLSWSLLIDFINDSVGWAIGWYSEAIFKTSDGGYNWLIQKHLSSKLNTIYVVDENYAYSAGEEGKILSTTNGGTDWSISQFNQDYDFFSIWFINSEVGVVTGKSTGEPDQGLILRTTNGGNNWNEYIVPEFEIIQDLQFINDSTGYCSGINENNEGFICRTSNTGDSWTVITSSDYPISSFNFFDADTVCAIIIDSLGYKNLMFSYDGGSTWVKKDLSYGSWRTSYSIYFYNRDVGYIHSTMDCGFGGCLGSMLFKSIDRGNNWTIQKFMYPLYDVHFFDRNVGFVSGGVSEWHSGNGDLFKTLDGGNSWINSFHSSFQVKSIFFIDPQMGFILSNQTQAGTNSMIHKTTNGGISWNEVYADDGDSTGFYFAGEEICFLNENVGWVAGSAFDDDSSGAAFLYTEDGGDLWDTLWVRVDSAPYHYDIYSSFFLNLKEGWAVGEGGLIVKYSENQWQSQTQVTDLPLNDVYFSDENHGWIAGGYLNDHDFQSIILKTTDGGITWQEKRNSNYLINDMFFEDSLNGIAVGNDTSRISIIGSWQFDRGHGVILKTNDGGENWSIVVEDLSARLTALHFKDGYGWAIGETGLVLRTVDGINWINDNSGKTYYTEFKLEQNFPNPFNPSTIIKYDIKERAFVELKIYDILGREVATLVNKEQTAGVYEVDFNSTKLSSGVYFYKIQAGEFVQTKKMILLK